MGHTSNPRIAALAAATVLAGLAANAQAQSCHPLEGAWTLNGAASELGPPLSFDPYYHVDAVTLTLQTHDQRIVEAWAYSGAHLNEHWTYAFVPDGRTFLTGTHSLVYSLPTSLSAAWQNCTLVMQARSSLFGRPITTQDVYVFSADGSALTILQQGGSPMLHIERKLVFQRR